MTTDATSHWFQIEYRDIEEGLNLPFTVPLKSLVEGDALIGIAMMQAPQYNENASSKGPKQYDNPMPDIMRTLIVDDKERNRLVLEKILSDYGTCESSRDGREAIEAFQAAWEGGTPFDLVCLDLQMPDIDGYKVLKIMRAMEKKMNIEESERCRIIVVSASYDPVSKKLSQTLGSDAYVLKPIDQNQLLECIKTFGMIK